MASPNVKNYKCYIDMIVPSLCVELIHYKCYIDMIVPSLCVELIPGLTADSRLFLYSEYCDFIKYLRNVIFYLFIYSSC